MKLQRALSVRAVRVRAQKIKIHPQAIEVFRSFEELSFSSTRPILPEALLIPSILFEGKFLAFGAFRYLICANLLNAYVTCCAFKKTDVSEEIIKESIISELASIPGNQVHPSDGAATWLSSIHQLMPKEITKKYWGRSKLSISQCAKEFNVDRGTLKSKMEGKRK